MNIGARLFKDGRCEFSVWAPLLKDVRVRLVTPVEKLLPMQKDFRGYWKAVEKTAPGVRYLYSLEGNRDRPDPASHFQPGGVHAPSEVVDHFSFRWEDDGWSGVPPGEMIIYELHIGAFTPGGTFAAAAERVPEIADLGVNTIEIMPVAQFPGERNWGYDGTYPFSVQDSYGGPAGLKGFVNECHKRGVSVILDVVYNHLGPEGSYVWDFGPYFTDRHKTPWGDAVNFDGSYSDGVRNYFVENALYWFENYHIDGLRLDAIHGIIDVSAKPFLEELREKVDEYSSRAGRAFLLIAESDLNDPKVVRPSGSGGYGFDALWCDDFHHSLHTLLTGEKDGYYADFGKSTQFVKALEEGFVYSGQYSEFRKRNHGAPAKDIPAGKFVVFSQNHDQVGNRMSGDRLTALVPFEALKLAAGAVIFSQYMPLIFMGEEYGEEAPFLYFISHSDEALIEAVRKGRKEEFSSFRWKGEPDDPQSPGTFLRSKLRWEKREEGGHERLLEFYRRLISLRKGIPALSHLDKDSVRVREYAEVRVLSMERWEEAENSRAVCFFNFSDSNVRLTPELYAGEWRRALDSADVSWGGPDTASPDTLFPGMELVMKAYSVALYVRGSDI